LHSSQENTQNSTIVIDGPCASNDPEESQTPDQNNMDIEITATPNKPPTSTQNLTAKPNNESPILIIGDSIIKHIDPRKISKRRVIKRTFPSKTANDIKARNEVYQSRLTTFAYYRSRRDKRYTRGSR
jgi:hypothetical protein